MRRTRWLFVAVLSGCGFGKAENIPISASSDETGSEPVMCGEIMCAADEVCVEKAMMDTGGEPSDNCVSVSECLVSPPDCTCIMAVCEEGQECVQIGFMPGRMFACQPSQP